MLVIILNKNKIIELIFKKSKKTEIAPNNDARM
jgi:hypothetical protein